MFFDIIILVVGLATLVGGGEFLIKGSVSLARYFSISPLVIGMTVVAFGTSAPELIVSVKAALSGSSEIAIGNVVGSNIANLGLVLGLTALIFPLIIDRQSLIVDWPMMIFASGLFYLFMLDGTIERWEGFILFLSLISFTVWLINNSIKNAPKVDVDKLKKDNLAKTIMFLTIGLVGLYFGSEWLLISAISIAENAGMSQHVIGVTIIAFGTSVPELATSVIAAFRKQAEISVGNLIGSNIFNILAVIGLTGILQPISVTNNVLDFDIFWVIGIALGLFPLMRFGQKITRLRGFLLLLSYVAYIILLLFH